jgi:hypothetical protein
MWRLDAIKVGDEIYFTLRRQVSSWFFTCITDYSQWVGFNVEAVRRGEFTAQLESHKVPEPGTRLILRKSGVSMPLVNLAAWHAFLGLTVPQLSKLYTKLSIPRPPGVPRPTTEIPLVSAMVKHLLDPTDAELHRILQIRRRGFIRLDFETLVDEDVLEACADLFEPGDFKDAKKIAKDTAARKSKAKEATTYADDDVPPRTYGDPPLPGPPGPDDDVLVPGAGSSSSRKPLPPPAHGIVWTQDEVKMLAPPRSTISREIKWDRRWRVQYKSDPIRSTQHMFAETEASERMAIIHCLDFLWRVHKDCTGEVSPFNFDEL